MTRTRYGLLHIAYLVLCGAAGWLWLLHETSLRLAVVPITALAPSWGVAAGFLALGLAAQLLSFDVGEDLSVSLDSAFYVAAMLILGPLATAWLVAVAMLIFTLRGVAARQRGGEARARPWRHELAALLYNSGGVALAVLGATTLLGLDGPAEGWIRAQWPVLYLLPLLALVFLGLHYAVILGSLWSQGRRVLRALRRVVLPSIAVEAMLVPLSMVLVLSYREANPVSVLLLGATFLVVNLVVRNLVLTRTELRERVAELKAINAVSVAIGSSLQTEEVLGTVVRETLRLVEPATGALLAVRATGEAEADPFFRVTVLERDAEAPEHRPVPGDEGLIGYVADRREALRLRDASGQGARFGPLRDPFLTGVRSFLGVPLVAKDEVIGVLAVVARGPGQFTDDAERLLRSVAVEAGLAVHNAHLFELATEDGLTRLYVRRYFDQRLLEEWHRARRYSSRFALILADLDDFKEINDRHGHPAGDVVLREFSARVQESLRANDIAARYGGEEFAVLLTRANTRDAERVAERIRFEVAAMRIPQGEERLTITASFGIASFPDCGDEDTIEDIFRKADAALYGAKAAGKNRVETWTADALDWQDERSSVIQTAPEIDREPEGR